MAKDNSRFTDTVRFVKADPKETEQLEEGIYAALRGEPLDKTKPLAWQRGHQIGGYRMEGDAERSGQM